ncbi:hypothetical protein CHS0354_027158 [Potamilus streckersoni]|uniref:Uncharacterized protein n=1 Tax=Potamilus streckersoni TaxID=2493646 RepID=A0AAE0WFW6_9BIVA|nr:hypothetical protein CHS0354_027158 [Potamilus streckersoni]
MLSEKKIPTISTVKSGFKTSCVRQLGNPPLTSFTTRTFFLTSSISKISFKALYPITRTNLTVESSAPHCYFSLDFLLNFVVSSYSFSHFPASQGIIHQMLSIKLGSLSPTLVLR